MPDWRERIDQLLYDGEHVESSVEVGTSTIVVTPQRVLAFTPAGDGERYRAIDRPNVSGVDRRSVSEYTFHRRAATLGIGGILAVAIGVLVDPQALLPRPDLSGARGAGGVTDGVQRGLDVFYLLDDVALVGGLLLLVVGLGLVGIQFATRRQVIAIGVAGGEDLLLDPPAVDPGPAEDVPADVDEPTVFLLERALDLGGPTTPAGTTDD